MAAAMETGAGGVWSRDGMMLEGLNGGCVMRVRRRFSAAATLLFLLTVLSGCDRSQRQTNKVHLAVSGSPANVAFLPHFLAQELGFYQEEAVEVQSDPIPGGKAMESLLGGSTDVVLGYYDHSIRVTAQGRAVKSFILITHYPGNVLLVSPTTRRNIRRIQDLKGAAVGVIGPASASHLFVNYALIKNGLSASDIKVVSVANGAAGIAALEHGTIDVFSGFDPGVTQFLRRHPDARILIDARDRQGVQAAFGTDVYPGAVLYSTANWLDQHQEAATRIVKGLVSSLKWMQDHSPEEIAAKTPASVRGQDKDIYVEVLRRAMPMFSEDGLMTSDAANAALNALRVSLESVRSAKIDLSQTYTNDFVARP
jgi:NitT/TauT family transport system substrate-binding protein